MNKGFYHSTVGSQILHRMMNAPILGPKVPIIRTKPLFLGFCWTVVLLRTTRVYIARSLPLRSTDRIIASSYSLLHILTLLSWLILHTSSHHTSWHYQFYSNDTRYLTIIKWSIKPTLSVPQHPPGSTNFLTVPHFWSLKVTRLS